MDRDICPMCRDAKGTRWSEKVALGQRSIREAAIAFGMLEGDVEEHVWKHETSFVKPAATTRAYDREYYVEKLESMHNDLQVWMDEIMDGAPTPENIRLGTTLVKELRETLRLMGEVTKILKDDEAQAALAAVKQMQARYLALTNIIVLKACPDCKTAILSAIDEQKKLMS